VLNCRSVALCFNPRHQHERFFPNHPCLSSRVEELGRKVALRQSTSHSPTPYRTCQPLLSLSGEYVEASQVEHGFPHQHYRRSSSAYEICHTGPIHWDVQARRYMIPFFCEDTTRLLTKGMDRHRDQIRSTRVLQAFSCNRPNCGRRAPNCCLSAPRNTVLSDLGSQTCRVGSSYHF
jgi:hypothetical protein